MTLTKIFLHGAWVTVSRLFGGLIAGLILGIVVFDLLPGSSVDSPSTMHSAIAAVPALAGFLAGGWFWGLAIGKFAGTDDPRRAARAGLIGFGPITLALAVGLSMLEPVLVANYGDVLPIHRLFMILFVTAAFLIAWVSTRAVCAALGAPVSAWQIGLSAAAAFLVTNTVMEAAGWVVGAPGAASRGTMLTVMFVSNLGAAIAAGGVLGLGLRSQGFPARGQQEAEASTV